MRVFEILVGACCMAGCGASAIEGVSADASTVEAAGILPDAQPSLDVVSAPDVPQSLDAVPALDVPPWDGPPYVVQLAVDNILHQCAVMSDGTVRCRDADAPAAGAVEVPGLTGVVQIVSGSELGEFCARHTDGTVHCWPGASPPQPTLVPGLTGAVQLAESEFAVCAVRSDGTVWCWGVTDVLVPVATTTPVMTSLRDVAEMWPLSQGWLVRQRTGGYMTVGGGYAPMIPLDATPGEQAAAGMHFCWRLADTSIRCEGINEDGELGNGTFGAVAAVVSTPVDPGLRGVAAVAQGDWNTCALMQDGTVQCWGQDESHGVGANGLGDTTCSFSLCRTTPTPVLGLDHVTRIFPGVWGACGLRTDRSVWCWGTLAQVFGGAAGPVAW